MRSTKFTTRTTVWLCTTGNDSRKLLRSTECTVIRDTQRPLKDVSCFVVHWMLSGKLPKAIFAWPLSNMKENLFSSSTRFSVCTLSQVFEIMKILQFNFTLSEGFLESEDVSTCLFTDRAFIWHVPLIVIVSGTDINTQCLNPCCEGMMNVH